MHISVTASGSCRSGLSPLISWLPSTPHLPSCLTVCALSSLTSRVIISHFFVLQSCHSDQLLASRPCVSTWLSLSLSHTLTQTHTHTPSHSHTHTHTLCCHFVCVCGEFPSSMRISVELRVHRYTRFVCKYAWKCVVSSALPCQW